MKNCRLTHIPNIHRRVLFCLLLGAAAARPCTTFVLRSTNHIYFGRNLDWYSEDALVIINPRNVRKSSLVMPGTSPSKWVSKYGSLTFNGAGWELPTGGMNEMGLVVENMWLDQTQCPAPDSRSALNSLQWIQYQLDNCRTVDEVAATDQSIRIDLAGFPIPVHYLVCDAAGDCAVFELLKGKMVCHRGEGLACRVLANEPYEAALAHSQAHPPGAESWKKLKDYPPFERFARAAARAAAFQPGTLREDLDYAFETLDEVAQGNYTVWGIVYDVTARQIHYRTRSHPAERILDLNRLDFACRGPVQFFELLSTSGAAARPRFNSLSEAKHRRYLERYLRQGWVKQGFGDMSPAMEAMLLNLRSYRCAKQPAGSEIALVPEAAKAGRLPAEEILRKALDARGGKEAASGIWSYHSKGTVDLPWLKGSPCELMALRPDKYRFTAELKPTRHFKGGRYDGGSDGQTAWEAQPGAACQRLEGKRREDCRQAGQFFAELDDPDECQSATCLGETLFEGRKCYVLQLLKNSGEETTHFYDAGTLRLAGALGTATEPQTPNAPVWAKTSFSKYRKINGFEFATRTEYSSQHSDSVVHWREIELNRVDDSIFKMPLEKQAKNQIGTPFGQRGAN